MLFSEPLTYDTERILKAFKKGFKILLHACHAFCKNKIIITKYYMHGIWGRWGGKGSKKRLCLFIKTFFSQIIRKKKHYRNKFNVKEQEYYFRYKKKKERKLTNSNGNVKKKKRHT